MEHRFLTLREIQEIEFNILEKFDEFCTKHNLYYTLAYGTMLGAVRHHGFIPWDDDIDVMMPRSDYEKFIRIFLNEDKIDGLEILDSSTPNYYYPFVKLCDSNTIAKMEDNCSKHGIWIDIFPVDSVPNELRNMKKFHRHMRFYKNIIISYTTDFNAKNKNWKFIPKFLFSLIGGIIGCKQITQYIEKEAVKYNCRYTDFVAVVSWQSSEGGNLKREEFFTSYKIKFENAEFNIPIGYDKYLRSIYGEYMNIPPENKRQTHCLQAWRI